jgi:hypothetical protein
MTYDPRHRLPLGAAAVFAVLAVLGAAWYALQRLCDWDALDDPGAWGAP